jgi:hypothetical protein
MLAAATTIAALLLASPSVSDADRIAANGGFLVGNAHRCGIDRERVVRAGRLVRQLIAAATADSAAEEAATRRFARFFLVSALADQAKKNAVPACKLVAGELDRLEHHELALAGAGAAPHFRPGDGE